MVIKMFRLESYIAPLVMSYIDRYVKLKTEDFRMSLWSGAVTLHQLDLRLDAIEESINLPVKLSNGHIRELKIQVTSVYFNQSVPVMFNKLIG